MQLQPEHDDVHSEDPQYIFLGALASCAEALERLTEASLALGPEAPPQVRRRLQDAVNKSSESFRFTVSAWDAWVRAQTPSRPQMRPEYDFSEGIRGKAGVDVDRPESPEPATATHDLNVDDEGAP